jgi:hypothetical protein
MYVSPHHRTEGKPWPPFPCTLYPALSDTGQVQWASLLVQAVRLADSVRKSKVKGNFALALTHHPEAFLSAGQLAGLSG